MDNETQPQIKNKPFFQNAKEFSLHKATNCQFQGRLKQLLWKDNASDVSFDKLFFSWKNQAKGEHMTDMYVCIGIRASLIYPSILAYWRYICISVYIGR